MRWLGGLLHEHTCWVAAACFLSCVAYCVPLDRSLLRPPLMVAGPRMTRRLRLLGLPPTRHCGDTGGLSGGWPVWWCCRRLLPSAAAVRASPWLSDVGWWWVMRPDSAHQFPSSDPSGLFVGIRYTRCCRDGPGRGSAASQWDYPNSPAPGCFKMPFVGMRLRVSRDVSLLRVPLA